MNSLAPCSNGSRMLRPMVLPPASRAPRLAAFMIPGPPPAAHWKPGFSNFCGLRHPAPAARLDDEPVILERERQAPRRQHAGELARLLVVLRPLDRLAALHEL